MRETKQVIHQDEQDDNAVIARCLAGEQAAYTTLYNRYAGATYRLCYSLLMNHHDVEDVMQEVFVYAFRNLSRYEPARASFKTWLYTIAVSRCRNTYRRKRLPQLDLSALFQQRLAAPTSDAPEAALARRNAEDALVHALHDLPLVLRECIILRYGHGLTYREIAAVMDCPPKTAESRVRLAHNRLRQILNAEGRGLLDELLSY